MTSFRRLLPLLLVAAATGAAGAQAPTLDASFQASKLEWDSQDDAIGQLVAFRSRNLDADSSLPSPLPAADLENATFGLEADRIDIEIDRTESYFDAGTATLAPPPATHTDYSSCTDAVVTGTTARAGQFLHVLPFGDGRVKVKVESASAAAAAGPVSAPHKLIQRPPLDADVSNALAIVPDEGQKVVIEGNFTMSFWERDGTITCSEGAGEFRSGKHSSPATPVDGRPFITEAQQIYYTVYGGKLRITGGSDAPVALFVQSIDVENASSIQLTEALGTVGVTKDPARGQSVHLDGSMAAQYRRDGAGVGVDVFSGLQQVTVDGRNLELAPATTATAAGGFGWGMPVAGILGLVGVAIVATGGARMAWVRRKHGQSVALEPAVTNRAAPVEDLLAAQQVEAALPAARQLHHSQPTEALPLLLLLRALRQAGHTREAIQFHERAWPLNHLAGLSTHLAGELGLERALAYADAARTAPAAECRRLQHQALQGILSAAKSDAAVLAELDDFPELAQLYYGGCH